jgi:hypothetical protein
MFPRAKLVNNSRGRKQLGEQRDASGWRSGTREIDEAERLQALSLWEVESGKG